MRIATPIIAITIISTTSAFSPLAPNAINRSTKPSSSLFKDDFSTATTEFSRPLLRRTRDVSSRLFMGWGPDPIWTDAVVAENTPACPSLSCVSLTVTVPADIVSQYKIAGQYVQMKIDGGTEEESKPIFLAIASPPHDPSNEESSPVELEFLIKKTDTNILITSAVVGATVSVSQVLGEGFPVAENLDGLKYDFPTQNVLLFAAGSGIAPIRAAIESGTLGVGEQGSGGKGRTARLYYGVRTPAEMPYADRFIKWERLGYEVVPVISRPEDCKNKWIGRTGYVQNALEEDGVAIPRNSGALLCGVKGMAQCVTEDLTKAGMFEGRVLTNF